MGRGASEHLWIVGKKRKDIVEAAAREGCPLFLETVVWRRRGVSEVSLESRDVPLVGDVACVRDSDPHPSLLLAKLNHFIM